MTFFLVKKNDSTAIISIIAGFAEQCHWGKRGGGNRKGVGLGVGRAVIKITRKGVLAPV